jgi:tetratricopeptide (TPR) repeat protein
LRRSASAKSALADLAEVLRLNPAAAWAHANRGNILDTKGDFEQALAEFDAAIRLEPDDARLYNNRGRTHARRGDFDKALADFAEAVRRLPDDPRGYYNRALTRYRLGDFAGAVADLGEVLRLGPPSAEVHTQRAAAHYALGDRAAAVADHRAALALDADDANAHNSLAWLLATSPDDALRDGAKAVEHAARACELTRNENPGFLDTLAAAHAECGRFDEAVRCMEKALALLPEEERADYRGRLDLYRAGRPFREG